MGDKQWNIYSSFFIFLFFPKKLFWVKMIIVWYPRSCRPPIEDPRYKVLKHYATVHRIQPLDPPLAHLYKTMSHTVP